VEAVEVLSEGDGQQHRRHDRDRGDDQGAWAQSRRRADHSTIAEANKKPAPTIES
jgi:hypothetical protein